MWPTFEQSLQRYQDVEQQLADPAVIGDRTRYTQLAKEHGSLAKLVKPYLDYLSVSDEVKHAQELIEAEKDAAMRKYAEEELTALRSRQKVLENKLEELY